MLSNLLRKLIPKNIAGILGVVESAIPVIREFLMLAIRICAIFIPGDKDDIAIASVKKFFDEIVVVFEQVKNFFLNVGV